MGIFHSYVSLPEGSLGFSLGFFLKTIHKVSLAESADPRVQAEKEAMNAAGGNVILMDFNGFFNGF